jgi:phage shock protein A
MSSWKDLLIDILKLTDEVKRLNSEIDRLQTHVVDVDKRVVRLETLVEVAKAQTQLTKKNK